MAWEFLWALWSRRGKGGRAESEKYSHLERGLVSLSSLFSFPLFHTLPHPTSRSQPRLLNKTYVQGLRYRGLGVKAPGLRMQICIENDW